MNRFEGALPPEIGNLEDLKVLIIAKNFFEGELPAEVGNLLDLRQFIASDNLFSLVIMSISPACILGFSQ